MPQDLSQQSLVEDALALVPLLGRQLLDTLQDALNAGPPQQHALLAAWLPQRLRFAERFQQVLTTLLQTAATGQDPLRRQAPRGLESLSLVDEQQALQDVAIAHVIHVVEDQHPSELHQLGNFFAALRGTARARKDDNPLRPALFAHSLQQAVQLVPLNAEGQYALMRAAAQPLAQVLAPLYAGLCARLREAELAPLIANRGQPKQSDELRLRRASGAYMDPRAAPTEPATLDGLARRVDAYNTRPQGLSGAAAVPPVPGKDMLTRLYDQILADPRLLPPVKALLARLQVAVARLAMSDLSLLRRQDHPTWLLLNKVSAHGAGFERGDDPALQDFLRFMDQRIEQLVSQPQPTALLFQQLLARTEDFIGNQARQRSERSSAQLAGLEREQMREPWLRVLHEQIQVQLADAADAQTTPLLRDFLQNDWARAIVQAMVRYGRDAAEAHACIDLVDELLASLRPPADEGQRLQQRAALPALIQRLQQGCDSIALAAPRRQAVLDELMRLHGRLLLGQGLAAAAAPEPAPPPLDPEAQLQHLLSERESQLPASRWAHTDVDRSRLPTVPVQLYNDDQGVDSRLALRHWIEQLSIGGWYHMFVQSRWLTAQLAWISESRQFFLFVGQDPEERHSLTRGALQHLLSHGLLTLLEEENLVQRAVETLMQDLSDPS